MMSNREILAKFISTEGYKRNSPDKNRAVNVIPSGNITMQDVDFPVQGTDNLGNQMIMMPGGEYTFPGNYVVETPMLEDGGQTDPDINCNNCGWSWKVSNGGKDPLTCHKCGSKNAQVEMKSGGQHGGLDRWFAEKWVDVKTGKDCGRQKGEKRAGYPACRPSKRISSETPKTASELSSAEKAKFKSSKTSSKRINYNHKKEEGGETGWLDNYQVAGQVSGAKTSFNIKTINEGYRKVESDNTRVAGPVKIYMPSPEEFAVNSRSYQAPDMSSKYSLMAYEKSKQQENVPIKDYKKSTSSEIQKLQSELQNLGYDIGKTGVDKIYGQNTDRAYKSKIQDDALDNSTIERYHNKYIESGTDKRVERIQKDLVNVGLLNSMQVDGKFGNDTKRAIEKHNAGKKTGSQTIEFKELPGRISDTRCAAGMCEILEAQQVPIKQLGMQYVDAWDMHENMNKTGNSKSIYNVYTSPEFKNIKDVNELKAATTRAKRNSQTTADMYKVGDVVGIYMPASYSHKETLNSKTHNTHVGWVQEIKNGVPIIAHNVYGKIHQDPYDKLNTTWIQRPDEKILAVSGVSKNFSIKYNPPKIVQYDSTPVVNKLEQKIERKLNPQEKKIVGNVATRANLSAKELVKTLNSSVDPKWVEQTVFGIAGTESAAGINAPRKREDVDLKKRIGYLVKDVDDKDISFGIGKVKYSSLDDFAKQYFQIKSEADLADDNKNVDVITYNLIKSYETFKDYSEKFPELGLTENDMRNMSILSHNQGTNRLLQTGRSKNKPFDDIKKEVEALRKLYQGKIKDVNSTNLKQLGFLGDIIFDNVGEEKETYISKVNRYANEVYNNTTLANASGLNSGKKKALQLGGQTNWLDKYN